MLNGEGMKANRALSCHMFHVLENENAWRREMWQINVSNVQLSRHKVMLRSAWNIIFVIDVFIS